MFKEKHIIQYYHITCAFETFKNAKLASKTLTNINELDGVENITEDERILIGNCIEEGNKTRADSIPHISALTSNKTAKLQRVTGARKATLKSHNEPLIKIMFSNADQLTSPKMCELITKIQQEHPMIVAICEVKPKNAAKERSEQDYKIRDYSLHPVNLTNDQGRGIAVYTHYSLDKSIVQINSDMNFEEACLLEVRLRGGDIMLFACCYRSPTHTHSSEENNEKLNRLFHALKKYSHRCILGDFNYRNNGLHGQQITGKIVPRLNSLKQHATVTSINTSNK